MCKKYLLKYRKVDASSGRILLLTPPTSVRRNKQAVLKENSNCNKVGKRGVLGLVSDSEIFFHLRKSSLWETKNVSILLILSVQINSHNFLPFIQNQVLF